MLPHAAAVPHTAAGPHAAVGRRMEDGAAAEGRHFADLVRLFHSFLGLYINSCTRALRGATSNSLKSVERGDEACCEYWGFTTQASQPSSRRRLTPAGTGHTGRTPRWRGGGEALRGGGVSQSSSSNSRLESRTQESHLASVSLHGPRGAAYRSRSRCAPTVYRTASWVA